MEDIINQLTIEEDFRKEKEFHLSLQKWAGVHQLEKAEDILRQWASRNSTGLYHAFLWLLFCSPGNQALDEEKLSLAHLRPDINPLYKVVDENAWNRFMEVEKYMQ